MDMPAGGKAFAGSGGSPAFMPLPRNAAFLPQIWAAEWRNDVQCNIDERALLWDQPPRSGVAAMMTKNPFMSAWLSWANRASSLWTTAAMSAAKRNQSAAWKAMVTPPKSGQAKAKPKRKGKPAR
nr:hypothetical protein [Azospirillum sp. 412522]